MSDPHEWTSPFNVNSSLPYFKQSRLRVTALHVGMSYDATLWEERTRQDIPNLLLASGSWTSAICILKPCCKVNYCHLCNWQKCFYCLCWNVIASKLLACNSNMSHHFMLSVNNFFTLGKLHIMDTFYLSEIQQNWELSEDINGLMTYTINHNSTYLLNL